ncbi:unnamed protein product, partial [Protopolystoma xenopodis]
MNSEKMDLQHLVISLRRELESTQVTNRLIQTQAAGLAEEAAELRQLLSSAKANELEACEQLKK